MINPFPHEIAINGVYFSPLLIVVVLAIIATLITTFVSNKLKLSRFIIYPQFAFLAIVTLYILLIDILYIKI